MYALQMSFSLIICFVSLCMSLNSMEIYSSLPSKSFLSSTAIFSLEHHIELAPNLIETRNLYQPNCYHGILINNLCECDEGYNGPDCFNCAEHYTQSIDFLCHPSPEILSVTPAGLVKVYKQEHLIFTLEFSQKPYLNSGQDSGFLLNASQSSIIPSYEEFNDSGLIWILTFDMADAVPEQAYKLILIEAAIVNAYGESFMLSELEMPMILIKEIEKDCVHGKIVGEKCICARGYEGEKCETCSDGYSYAAGLCRRNSGYARYYIVYGSVGIMLGFFSFHLRSNKRQKMELENNSLDSNDIDLFKESKQSHIRRH